jgi:hypothetical protein
VGVLGELRAPDVQQQLPVRHHLAGAAHQAGQQVELGGRQMDFLAVQVDVVRFSVRF